MLQFFKKLYENVKNLFTPKMEAQSTEVDMEAAGTQIKYYLNDPSTPNLMGYANNPQTYKLQFAVKYFTGNGGPLDRPVGQAANVYAVLCHSINVLNRKADLSKWAVVNKLNVDPLAGVQANAYYDRQGLKFFYFTNKGQKVFTCLSADIITHELGHGLLDAMRPEFFNMAALELWAFHESFGDVSAILSSLAQPAVVKNMLETTGGDLRKPNIVEGLAEQFGSSLGLGGALRKGVNNFKYVSPSTLPQRAPNDQLAAESHSFSRVLTGAFYEIFVKAYEMFGKGVSGVDQARELLMETFINASKKAPSSSNFFQVFSKTWLDILKLKSPTIGEQMRLILVNRNLLGLPMSMQSSSFSQDKFDLVKQNLLESKTEDSVVIVNKGEAFAKDLLNGVMFASDLENKYMDEILQLKVSVPCDEALYNDDGKWLSMCASTNQACEDARCSLLNIIENDMYGPEEDKSWYKDEENNLVRKFISCCGDNGYTNNCLVPGNPEFGKCWKCKNNTGCCTYGSCGCEQKPKPRVYTSCACRYNSCTGTRYNASCGFSKYNSNLCNSQG